MKSTIDGKGMGMSGTMTSTTYIKGNKMRTDIVTGDTTRTTIFDVDTQKMYLASIRRRRKPTSTTCRSCPRDMSKNVQVSEMKASIKPNGKTKEIAGKTATGYDMDDQRAGHDGRRRRHEDDASTSIGPMWIVKGAPGTAEYLAFYKSRRRQGLVLQRPARREGAARPGQGDGRDVQRQLASTGGIPYEQEMNIKMSGDGPMAGVLAKMGNITTTTTVTGD